MPFDILVTSMKEKTCYKVPNLISSFENLELLFLLFRDPTNLKSI